MKNLSLYVAGGKVFQWWYLNLAKAASWSPQLLWFTSCCEAKSQAYTLWRGATWLPGRQPLTARNESAKPVSTNGGHLLWANSGNFFFLSSLVDTQANVSPSISCHSNSWAYRSKDLPWKLCYYWPQRQGNHPQLFLPNSKTGHSWSLAKGEGRGFERSTTMFIEVV